MNNINWDKYATFIYEQNKAVGWWDDPNRCIYQTLQLVSTEIAEATEGERKNLMDDHLPDRKMGEVELADALIRILDLAGKYGWHHAGYTTYHRQVRQIDSIAGKHLILNMILSDITTCILNVKPKIVLEISYTIFVNSIMYIGELQEYDIEAAMVEKLKYNQTRADHKRENRAKVNGKKF